MKVAQAEKKVRQTVIEIRKLSTNRKWCNWADAWLSSTDRSAASAESAAKVMARGAPKASAGDRPPTRATLLKESAGNAALAAAIVARSGGEEIDPFASMILAGYLKKDDPAVEKKNKRGQKPAGKVARRAD